MMWMWISSIVILVGAELNSEIEHQTARDSTTGDPATKKAYKRGRGRRAPTLPSEVSEGSERLHEIKSDGNCTLKVQLQSRRTRGVPAAVIEVRGLVGSDQLNDA
jgi:hypothetical protein